MVTKTYLKEIIYRLYWIDKKSTTDIARILNIDQRNLTKFMHQNVIPKRTRREGIKLWWKQQKEKEVKNE